MKIIVTGQGGLLSRTLFGLNEDIICLSSSEYDIRQPDIIDKLHLLDPDIIIHAAAKTNSIDVRQNPTDAIDVNIIGTAYIAEYCILNNARMIYISTDYVYPGTTGNYTESDTILPVNEYAWTKLGGECSVKLVPNHLIIRTSFGSTKYPYEYAWDNLITSKDYVDIIAPMIYKSSISSEIGILNIGTEPKSIYEYATKRNSTKRGYTDTKKDFSLNLEKYEKLFNN